MNCRALSPILNSVKADYPKIKFREVNVSADDAAANKYAITSLPTLIFVLDGEFVGRLVGLKPKTLIIKKIKEAFNL